MATSVETPPVAPLLIICWQGSQPHWWELIRVNPAGDLGRQGPTLVVSPQMRERAVTAMPEVPVVDAGPSLQNLLECIISELGEAA